MDLVLGSTRGDTKTRDKVWSSSSRPTVNTSASPASGSSSTPLNLSPPPSSVPHSAHSSPWTLDIPLGASVQAQSASFMLQQPVSPTSHQPDIPTQFASQSSTVDAEWGNMFSNPLDPSTFHKLAAQGVFGPPPAGVPSSLSSRSNHTPHDFGVNTRAQPLNAQDISRSGIPMAWSNVSSPYASPPATSHRESPVHLRSGSGASASFTRRKSPGVGVSQSYGPVNLRHPSSSMPLPISPFDAPGDFNHDRRNSLSQQLAGAHIAGPSGRGSAMSLGLDTHLDNLSTNFPSQRSSFELNSHPVHHPERFAHGIPPSLWMSSTNVPSSSASYSEASLFSFNQIPHPRQSSISESLVTSSSPTALSLLDSGKSTAPTSASSPKERVLSDLFSDALFPPRQSVHEKSGPRPFASPKVSGSPDLQSVDLAGADADPEQLAREDPLATQVWKMYARQKATLPHAQRMENLTWRMMALALKKKKEDEGREKERAKEKNRDAEAQKGGGPGSSQSSGEKAAEGTGPSTGGAETAQETERGRTIDKGKARVQVVGFDGANQDGADENEYVCEVIAPSSVLLSSVFHLLAKCRWTGVRSADPVLERLWIGGLRVALVPDHPWAECQISRTSSSSLHRRHPSAM